MNRIVVAARSGDQRLTAADGSRYLVYVHDAIIELKKMEPRVRRTHLSWVSFQCLVAAFPEVAEAVEQSRENLYESVKIAIERQPEEVLFLSIDNKDEAGLLYRLGDYTFAFFEITGNRGLILGQVAEKVAWPKVELV